MAAPELIAKLKEGVVCWNEWRQRNLANSSIDFSEADLSRLDLTGANLGLVSFQGADLQYTQLGSGTYLVHADFSRANLGHADLRGANLDYAIFVDADLTGTALRNSSLRCVDLGSVRGAICAGQLAGSDLTGAQLPAICDNFSETIENVKNISDNARKLFLVLLASCLYACLTIATTTDVNLVTNRASSPLPIIQTSIPIVGFYILAPLLLVGVFFYFNFYLQKLWEELSTLPAYFPDGRALFSTVDPWLLNDLVKFTSVRLMQERTPLSYVQLTVSKLLTWWTLPATLVLFWIRYLPRHDWIGTGWHIGLVALSITTAWNLYHLALTTIKGEDQRSFTWTAALSKRRTHRIALSALALILFFSVISLGAIDGRRSGMATFGKWIPSERYWDNGDTPNTWVPRLLALMHFPPFANLYGAELSQRGAGLFADESKGSRFPLGAELSSANLRYAQAEKAYMELANLQDADLTGAVLYGAMLKEANLERTKLNDSWLTMAVMTNASLVGSDLKEANLNFSKSGGADFDAADLTGAKLSSANLVAAKFGCSWTTEKELMDGVNKCADLSGAVLTDADLAFADFRGAQNVSAEQLKEARNWDEAMYDPALLAILGLPMDHNATVEQMKQKSQANSQSIAPTPTTDQ